MNVANRPIARTFGLVIGFLTAFVPSIYSQESGSAPSNTGQTNAEVISEYKTMSLEQLMNQQVTSVAKAPQPYMDAPAAIDVITSNDIQRSGATSLPQALRLANNLDVEQLSSSQWDISARGFNTSGFSDKMLVLMDGRSLYSPLLAGVIWNLEDYLLPDIDRIEVISGPGGALWGANAVNGVINITTKNAADTQGLFASAAGGTWMQTQEQARYGGTISSNIFYRVYGKYVQYGAERYPDSSSAHDNWNRGMGGFRIDATPSPGDLFMLEGNMLGGDNDTAPGGEGTPVIEGTSSDGNVLGQWKHKWSDDSDMQLQLYYDRTHLSAPFQSDTIGAVFIPQGLLRDDLDTADANFQDRFPLGDRNKVVWGLEYRFTHNVNQPAPLADFIPNTLDQNLYSAFAQDQITLFDHLYLTLGSKLEHNDYTGFEWEPSARLQWNVSDNQMLWGAISRAVRMPSEYDRNLYTPSPDYLLFLANSNSTFASETLIAYEAGYRAQFNNRVSGSLSAFFNDYSRLRSLDYTPGGASGFLPLYWANNDDGETWGFELNLNYQLLPWWRLNLGYDFLHENIFTKSGTVDLDARVEDTADPENQVFIRSAMDLPHHIEFDADGRWIDRAQFDNGAAVGAVPAYFELDLSLGWHLAKNIEVSVTGQNLIHDQHVEAGYPYNVPQTQEAIVRNVYGQVTWQF